MKLSFLNKTDKVLLLYYIIYMFVLLGWFAFLEVKWFANYYGVAVDYLRVEIYSLKYFIAANIIFVLAYFFLKNKIITLLLGTLPITNVPVISSGVGMIYHGSISLLFVALIFKIAGRKFFVRLRWGPESILLIYLSIHSLFTIILRYDSGNYLHLQVLIKLTILALSIYCISLIRNQVHVDRAIHESMGHGLRYQAITLAIFAFLVLLLMATDYVITPNPYAFHSMISIDRLTLGFNHPNELALYLVGMSPYLIRWSRSRSFLVIFCVWILFFLACTLTMSRALIFPLALIFLIYSNDKKSLLLLKGMLLSFLVAIFALLGSLRLDDFYSIDSRSEDYEAVLQAFVDSPFSIFFGFGFGISGYGFPQPHNIVIDILYNIGLVGLSLYLIFIFIVFRSLMSSPSVGVYSVAGIIVYGIFHSLWTNWLFYFFIAFALLDAVYKKKLASCSTGLKGACQS